MQRPDAPAASDLERAMTAAEEALATGDAAALGWKLALDEVARLRQGLWDCAIRTGWDNDGDETPDHLAYPDIVTLALREIERLRADYDALIEGGYDRG